MSMYKEGDVVVFDLRPGILKLLERTPYANATYIMHLLKDEQFCVSHMHMDGSVGLIMHTARKLLKDTPYFRSDILYFPPAALCAAGMNPLQYEEAKIIKEIYNF